MEDETVAAPVNGTAEGGETALAEVTGNVIPPSQDEKATSLAVVTRNVIRPSQEEKATSLAEVTGNVIPPSQEEKATIDAKAWGGDVGDENALEKTMRDLGVKKKKKKSKSKKKGLNAPSGFEEFYVDVPVTPEVFQEERLIYHSSKSFSERIETAIQRYVAKRKFDSERKDLFDKYMVYGGVDTGPKMFGGGLSKEELEQSTTAELAQITATHYVNFDESDPRRNNCVVDFDGVLKGFLSSRLPLSFDVEEESRIKQHTSVIRNFLNYLLHHDVCPEYNDQINAARATCDLANKEIWAATQGAKLLPGAFNKSCSTVFGGSFQGTYIGDQEWTRGLKMDVGISPERAKKIFLAGMAALGDQAQLEKYNQHVKKGKAAVVETIEQTGLEIVALELPNQEIVDYYANPNNPVQGLSPLGRMRVKTWYNPGAPPEDLTEEEEAELAAKPKPIHQWTLWLEKELLETLYVGMKLQATIRKLSFGVYYFDTVTAVLCSFFDMLPNELMLGWKEHKYLPPRQTMKDGTEIMLVNNLEDLGEVRLALENGDRTADVEELEDDEGED